MSPLSRKGWSRTTSTSVAVGPGEKVLASATATDGTVLAGTRDAFYVVAAGETRRVPWEQVEAADWDRDTDVFRLSEVGSWGDQRPVHAATLTEPGRLLELVRERVTASVVLSAPHSAGSVTHQTMLLYRPVAGLSPLSRRA